ncbi:MAG: DUF2924 domain-containing protein [Heliobacteriaceae bacterium]|nr:DUF2924 domain-containing protein [Heliobacteriaceae bacterium]
MLDLSAPESDRWCMKIKTAEEKLKKWHQKYGGFTPEVQRKLDKLVLTYEKSQNLPESVLGKVKTNEISQGTRFIREFKDIKHEVVALDKGFEYKSEVYGSLSAIANKITGTRWNGKKFFGVCK